MLSALRFCEAFKPTSYVQNIYLTNLGNRKATISASNRRLLNSKRGTYTHPCTNMHYPEYLSQTKSRLTGHVVVVTGSLPHRQEPNLSWEGKRTPIEQQSETKETAFWRTRRRTRWASNKAHILRLSHTKPTGDPVSC